MQARVARLLNVGGFVAPVLWVAAFLYSGSLRPEYSHYRQYVSELAARGTPTQHFMQVTGFVIPGLLIAGFGYFLGMPARAWLVVIAASFLIVSGIAKAVAGVFPLDPCCTSAPQSTAQEIHNFAGGVYYVTLGMAALMWTVAGGRCSGVALAGFGGIPWRASFWQSRHHHCSCGRVRRRLPTSDSFSVSRLAFSTCGYSYSRR